MARTWAEMQAAFAAAITDSGLPPPRDILECGGGSLRRTGFSVYRNNGVVGLIEALQERFPVTRRLVGDEFFRAMARSYAREHRPGSPLLMQYGNELPTFIAQFAPANAVPYLSDVARLEIAWSEAYHAEDRHPLAPHLLACTPVDVLLGTRLMLHPSVRLVWSQYPIADIWAAHQSADEVTGPARWIAQGVLIVRPDADVHVHTLWPGMHAFVSALLDHMCVQAAAEIAAVDHREFDAGESMVELFRMGAVVALDADYREREE